MRRARSGWSQPEDGVGAEAQLEAAVPRPGKDLARDEVAPRAVASSQLVGREAHLSPMGGDVGEGEDLVLPVAGGAEDGEDGASGSVWDPGRFSPRLSSRGLGT